MSELAEPLQREDECTKCCLRYVNGRCPQCGQIRITFAVTHDDAVNGEPENPCKCLIARALNEAPLLSTVCVMPHVITAEIRDDDSSENMTFRTYYAIPPAGVGDLISWYDGYGQRGVDNIEPEDVPEMEPITLFFYPLPTTPVGAPD